MFQDLLFFVLFVLKSCTFGFADYIFPDVKVRLVSYLTNDGRFFMYMDSGIKKNFASAIKKSSI